MQNRTTAPSVYTLLFLLLALLCGNGLRAQITYDNLLPKSGITPGALLTVSDPDTTQTGPGVFVNRTQYLSLVYTTEAHTDVQNYTAWRYGVVVKIMNGADTTQYFTDTLDIRRNDSLPQYQALNHYTLPWYSLHIRVLSVCGKTGTDSSCVANPHTYPLLPEDIELQAAIIRTQINGFAALLDIPTGPVEYDEGDVLASCEEEYNDRLNDLRTEHDALAEQRLSDFMGGLTVNAQDMEALNEAILAQTLTEMNRLVDTLTHADSLYYYQCDSLPIDTAHLTLLRNVARETFLEYFYTPYFAEFSTRSKEMYLGNQNHAQTVAADSMAYIDRVFDGFDHWGINTLGEVWALYPPGTGTCVMDHFGDTAAHWSERALAIIHNMYSVRKTVLDDEGVSDSLYLLYHGAKHAITIQTNSDYAAAVDALNEDMLAYCGYGGSPMGDCQTFYNNLLNANKAYTAALMDSVADTVSVIYNIPPNLLGEANPAVTAAISGLLAEYNGTLHALDLQWAACGADSAQADTILQRLNILNLGSNSLPSQFLGSRQGALQNQYRSTATVHTLGEWQTLTGNLVTTYRTEGKDLVLDKQAAIHTEWPELDSCTNATYLSVKAATEDAVGTLLAKIDSTLDTLDVYGSVSSYTYEIALAHLVVDFENDPAHLAALAEADSILTEKIENCGSGTPPPAPESYMACLARTEAELRNLQYGRGQLLAGLDSLTENFRGIARPGGWNDANADILQLLESLLGEQRYRLDSLVVAEIAPCITDSILHQQFLDLATYDAQWEQTYFQQTFIPAYQTLFPDVDYDIVPYVTEHFDSLTAALGDVYMGYFGERLGERFFNRLPTWNLDSNTVACIDSVGPLLETEFGNRMQAFFSDMDLYLEAGAVGITPNDSAYRESVVYYSLLRAAINKTYWRFFDQANQARLQCSSVLKDAETPVPDDPGPITPSIEAEIAACQTDVENRFNELGPLFETAKEAVLELAFASEISGGMNIVPLQIALADSIGLRMHRSLDPVDSLWLACNTDPDALAILSALFDSDVSIAALFEHPPAYTTNPELLYVAGNTAQPDYSHVSEFGATDSLLYMALAQIRAEWMVEKIQEQPDTYGVADSCIIHHETDSATEAQYAATYADHQNEVQNFWNTFLPLYDSTTIDPDTLLLKLRWVYAAQVRETYLFLQQYVALEQEYAACEDLRSQLIVWRGESDPARNQPKKGIGNKYPVKPVGKFPLLPITPTVMDLTTSTVTVVTESGPCGNVKYLEWTPITQAVEYDLEWAYIDSMVYLEGNPANQHADINYLAFSLTEPTRVTVKENRFPFPGEYPNGKLYFRVRGVARIIDAAHQSYDQPQFFPWIYNWSGYAVSSANANFNASNPFNNVYENNLNWQWEASFAEEGKFKRVISYHDGLNRPRQVVTHLSTDNLSVIGETLYDHEGRAAVQVLPYPEPCYELSYRDETRADSLGGAFSKEDFELTAGSKRMSVDYGASQYYSANNPFMAVENPLMHTGAIPDAKQYPYTQTAFLLDNTGRPTRSGGVGADHTLNGEHATRYYYANASETELRRLFGQNVGLAAHYKKNAVMDANGQLSVAYVDQEGRSVATALAGLSPDNVLPLESNQPFAFTQNLTGNNIHDAVEAEWNIHYGQLNEIPGNEYTFTYQYGLDRLFEGTTPPCIVCEFDLEIYITDPDGNRLPLTEIMDGDSSVADTNYFHKRLDATSYELSHPCSSTTLPKEVTFTVVMPEVNTYTVHKNLRWDKETALADIWAASQPAVNSYTASVQTAILNSYISQINYDVCEQMFPGTGFGAIPEDVLDNTNSLATTGQCESYLNKMIDQITPYLGPQPSPTTEYPAGSSAIVNSGIYGNDNTFWNKVTTLISDGHAAPNNPEFIPPSAWASFVSGTTNIPSIVNSIRNNPGQWTDELKRQLVKAHPEYCWYKKCLSYAESVPYDADMAQKTNLSDGQPYRNPLNQSEPVTPFTNTGMTVTDPINGNTDERPVIVDETLDNNPNGNTSIWEAADLVQDNYTPNTNLTADEAAWQTFRGGYLQAKSDAFFTATGGCAFLGTPSAVVVAPPELPDTEGEMDNANSDHQADWEAQEPCGDICDQNALAWTAQLFANCGEVGTEMQIAQYDNVKQQVRHKLYEYCITQCGTDNPFGIITEQMFADAMASGTGLLWEAMELYNDHFAGLTGCNPIQTGTQGIDSTFTYGEEEYTEQCHEIGVSLTTNYSVLNFINKINAAFDDMTSATDNFTIDPWVTSGGAEISIDHPLQTGSFTYECLLINVDNCSEYVPRSLDTNLCNACTVKFLYANPDRPNDYVYITAPETITQINPATSSFYVFESNGDVTVPATFVLNVSPWLRGGVVKFNIHGCCSDTICRILPNPWVVDIDTDSLIVDCEELLLQEAHQNAANAFDNWLENYVDSLWQQTECVIAEDLRCTYTKSEYHYTLYYYDQAANLVQTVPPKGVHPLDVANTVHFSPQGHWPGSTPTDPPHDMESRYKFNSLEVAIESETPDGGLTLYTPDAMGRPMQSRNAEQRKRATALGSGVDVFSYTNYDNLGRITAVSEIWGGYTPTTGLPIYQTTSTKYDTPVEIGQIGWKSENTRSRVSYVQYYEDNNVPRHTTFYSYDIHGNVKSMVTQVPALKGFGQEFHRVDYYYDLVSGKVNEVHYQPKGTDRIYYRYRYDGDNRLVTAETSRDYVNWERDAKYFYYPHGPLKRVETGHRKVQGTDYFYTVHGWLKGVNSGALNETYDVGRDGDIALGSNPNAQVARDAFGFTLDYYDGDYRAVGTTGMNHIPDIDASGPGDALLEYGLYNGNIAHMGTALRKPDETRLPVLGYSYMYDQLNRIKQNYAYLSANLHSTNSWNGIMGSNAYKGTYSYDANGNILSLQRYDGSAVLRDDFTAYNYTTKSAYSSGQFHNYKGPQNRLDNVDDAVSSGTFSDDMDDQSAANYSYDEIGNLVKDEAEEIDTIEWTVYGKVKSVKRETGSKKPDLYFYYNGSGQRYFKVVIPKNQSSGAVLGKHEWKATYYQHDAQGNILAIYNIKGGPENCGYDMLLSEHVLYGSSRLGTATYNQKMGYASGSLAYPAGSGFNVCYTESDEVESDREPMGGQTTGPIGGGTMETIKPYGPHKVPDTRVPIVGVNLPWAGGGDVTTKPTKQPTTFVPGRKRYEFSNHLGNVLVTVSDKPLGVDGNSDGIAEYYMPDVKTTSDYEPFGAPLYGRTLGEQVCSTYTDTGTVQLGVITETFDSSYTLAAVQAYDKWYRGAATTASVVAGALRFKRVNTNVVSVGRGFTAVAGKPYSLTFKRWKQGTSNNTLQVFVFRVSTGADVYTTSLSLPVGAGSAATHTLTDFFTPTDNGNYIFGFRCLGSDTSTVYIDDVVFTRKEITYTNVTDCQDVTDTGYRFGFNGQLKDDEVYGEGNAYDFEFRTYDPRIGKFLSIDPLTSDFPWYSPYQFAGNTPIWCIDVEGAEDLKATSKATVFFARLKLVAMNDERLTALMNSISDPSKAAKIRVYFTTENLGLGGGRTTGENIKPRAQQIVNYLEFQKTEEYKNLPLNDQFKLDNQYQDNMMMFASWDISYEEVANAVQEEVYVVSIDEFKTQNTEKAAMFWAAHEIRAHLLNLINDVDETMHQEHYDYYDIERDSPDAKRFDMQNGKSPGPEDVHIRPNSEAYKDKTQIDKAYEKVYGK